MSFRRFLAASVAVVTAMSFALPAIGRPMNYPAPVEDGLPSPGPPDVTAEAWILYDESTDAVLGSVLADQRRSVASTTKIMTGLLAVEHGDLDEPVIVSQRAADTGEREIGLVAGEVVTLGALLKAALIHSGHDAATAIAEHVASLKFAMLTERKSEEAAQAHKNMVAWQTIQEACPPSRPSRLGQAAAVCKDLCRRLRPPEFRSPSLRPSSP